MFCFHNYIYFPHVNESQVGTLGFSSWSAYHTEQFQSQGAEVIYLYPAISAKLPLFSAKSKSHSVAIISDSLDEIKLAVEKII